MHRAWAVLLSGAMSTCFAGRAAADVVCPDQSYCIVNFATGKDRITIVPGGTGETFASAGITIDVYLRHCDGRPYAGIPAQEVMLYSSDLCICPGGSFADAQTNLDGYTSFSGTLSAGGCAENLSVYTEGIFIATIPVKTNSPDLLPASPCRADASDVSAVAALLGRADRYTACADWNESGPPTIDAGDLSYFASQFGAQCPPAASHPADGR